MHYDTKNEIMYTYEVTLTKCAYMQDEASLNALNMF